MPERSAAPPPPSNPDAVFVQYRPNRRRRRWILAGVGAVVMLVAAGSLVRIAGSTPESTVRSFFDALAARDPAGALRVTAPEIAGPASREVIDESVLGSPDYLPPADVQVAGVTIEDRDAVAEVSFTVAGREHQVAVRLRRDDGFRDTLLPRWLVIDAIGSIGLGAAPPTVTVNGRPVPAYDPQGPRFLPVLPGGYQVGVPDTDPLWQQRAVAVQVAPPGAATVDVPMVPRPEVRDQVERQLTARLDRCADSAELAPPGCPFGYRAGGRVEDVGWRIARYPAVALSAERRSGETVLAVASSRDGEAVVTGDRGAFGRLDVVVPFPISGVATFRGTAVVFQPDW